MLKPFDKNAKFFQEMYGSIIPKAMKTGSAVFWCLCGHTGIAIY
jgi:hypothetical protein